MHPQPQRQREDHGAENPCDHPIFEREGQPQQGQRHPEDYKSKDSRTIHVPVYNEIGANRGLVALRWYAKRPNDWEKTPLGGVFSLDWQLTLSPMT
jgi:hypothetical protein